MKPVTEAPAQTPAPPNYHAAPAEQRANPPKQKATEGNTPIIKTRDPEPRFFELTVPDSERTIKTIDRAVPPQENLTQEVVPVKPRSEPALQLQAPRPVAPTTETLAAPQPKIPENPRHTIKTIDRDSRSISTKDAISRQTVKPREVPKVGNAHRSVKTARRAEQRSVQVAAEQKTMAIRTEKTAQQSTRAAHKAAKTAAAKAEAAAKATADMVRQALAGAKALLTALLSGSGAVGIVIICLCLIGALAASPFGILFTGQSSGNGTVAITSAIYQINREYASQLDTLQSGDYDSITVVGAPPDWRDVIAVFAVHTAGKEDGIDVATLDRDRVNRLKTVFWDMTEITSEVEVTYYPDSDPNDGIDDSYVERDLTITITAKSVDDMRTEYSFTQRQNDLLDELLANRNLLDDLLADLHVTDANAEELLRNLPDDLDPARREVIKTACSLVGKVPYFWGGKSRAIGWDSRWGQTMQVTAGGSSTTGTYRPFGLDCSGFVDWVFWNVSDGTYLAGHGGGAATQHYYSTNISWDEALPGDLVFFSGDVHVGIVGGRDEDGDLVIVHCGGGGVSITGPTGFVAVARPEWFE